MLSPYIGCTVKQLPSELHVDASHLACLHNPVNAVPAARGVMEPQRAAILTTKYWGVGGVDLTVQFLDLPGGAGSRDDQLRQKILAFANRGWGSRANVRFRWTQGQGQIRIARGPGGYWSYLGTDNLMIPANQQTMNLERFTLNTPDSEFLRVVQHEFGHVIGLPHEHMRPEVVEGIDPAAAIAYFGRTQGWSPDEVRQQVLTPLDPGSLRFLAPADVKSIMCYALPGDIMRNRQPVPGGVDLDEIDLQLAASIYPKASAPPSPPPPVSPPVVAAFNQILIDLEKKFFKFPPSWSPAP